MTSNHWVATGIRGRGSFSAGFSKKALHSWQNSCRPLTREPQCGQKAGSYSGSFRLAPQDWQKRWSSLT